MKRFHREGLTDPCSGSGVCPVLESGDSKLASGALSGGCEATVHSGTTHLLSFCAVKSLVLAYLIEMPTHLEPSSSGSLLNASASAF